MANQDSASTNNSFRPRSPGRNRLRVGERRQRDDLFIDATEDLLIHEGPQIPGMNVKRRSTANAQVSDVEVLTPEAGRRIGKAPGHYITIEAPNLRSRSREVEDEVSQIISEELGKLTNITEETVVLVVGLGNEHATPDALGPRVVDNLLITRHLKPFVPEDLRGQLHSVCAVAPGVLGTTGIETGEIIRGIVDRVQPDVVVAVDSLASRSIERMLTTIQIANTGIQPASGVGSARLGITEEVLGVPVIALGVPTVVHAMTIANETINHLSDELQSQSVYALMEGFKQTERKRLITDVLGPLFGDLMVTAKEIDVFIEDLSDVIAAGLNTVFHPEMENSELLGYLF